MLIDTTPRYIESCIVKFFAEPHITYHVSNKHSLPVIEPNSIDFILSLDSLVFEEKDVIKSYLNQFKNILKQNGAGFIHHSNLGQYLPSKNNSISGILFIELCNQSNLVCTAQEFICTTKNYNTYDECYSTFVNKESKYARNTQFLHTYYQQEIDRILNLTRLYD